MKGKRRGRNFELSDEVKSLIARGRIAAIGDVIGYSEWSAVAGADVLANRHLLYGAFYRLNKDSGIVFGCVEGVGYKRLNASEIVGVVGDYLPRINRATRRAKLKGGVARDSYHLLSPGDQVRLNVSSALLGALSHFSAPAMTRQSIKYANEQPPSLPSDLGAFAKS